MTSTPPYSQAAAPPAAVRNRVIAGAIDLIGGAALVAGLGVLLSMVIPKTPVAWLVAAAAVVAPRELVLALTGWSPGGRLMGVRLVSAATGGPPRTRLFIHADLLCVTLGLGAVVFMSSAASSPRGQGWHDRMAGTVAVSTRSGSTAAPRRQAAGQQAPGRQDVAQQAPKRQAPRRQSIRHQTHTAAPPQHATGKGPARERARVFPDNAFFLNPDGSSTDIGSTVDTASAVVLPPASDRAIIDSVPWAAVPTQLDMPTRDDSPLVPQAPASPAPAAQGAADPLPASPLPAGPSPMTPAPTGSDPAAPGATDPFSPPPPMVRPFSMPSAQTEALPATLSPTGPDPASAPTPAPTGSAPAASAASVPTPAPGPLSASPTTSAPASGPPVPVGPFPVAPPAAGPRPASPFAAGSPSASPDTPASSAPHGVSSSSPHEAVVPSPVTAPARAPRSPSPEEPIIVPPPSEPLSPPSSTPPARTRMESRSAASAEPLISTDSVPSAQPVVSASSPPMARGRHRHTEDPRASRLVPLTGGAPVELSSTTVVGRDPDNISEYPGAACVPLNDANRSISKTHAVLAPAPGGLWLTDLHSTNGTRIEEDGRVTVAKPNESIPVPTGATIVLGSAAYRVED